MKRIRNENVDVFSVWLFYSHCKVYVRRRLQITFDLYFCLFPSLFVYFFFTRILPSAYTTTTKKKGKHNQYTRMKSDRHSYWQCVGEMSTHIYIPVVRPFHSLQCWNSIFNTLFSFKWECATRLRPPAIHVLELFLRPCACVCVFHFHLFAHHFHWHMAHTVHSKN